MNHWLYHFNGTIKKPIINPVLHIYNVYKLILWIQFNILPRNSIPFPFNLINFTKRKICLIQACTPFRDSFPEYYLLVSKTSKQQIKTQLIVSLCLIRQSSFKINPLLLVIETLPLIRVCHVIAFACLSIISSLNFIEYTDSLCTLMSFQNYLR
jgi:hypothetical protein